MGLTSQSMVWRELVASDAFTFFRVPWQLHTAIWTTGAAVLAFLLLVYAAKIVVWPGAVAREFLHPVRTNFVPTPLLSALFLLLGAPTRVTELIGGSAEHPSKLAVVLVVAPMLFLELIVYGRWMVRYSYLNTHVNPTTQMSVVGNFVAASALAHVGWPEAATFFLAIGFAFQTVVFVSLFQHPYIDRLVPSKLYPVFFLLIAPPTSAANALALVNREYSQGPRMLLFLGMFIYMMLALRIRVWISIGFSLSWWAYTFPMASAALAVGAYATEIDHEPTRGIALALCAVSTLAVVICMGQTVRQALFSTHMLKLFPPEEVLFLGWDDRDHLLRSHAYLLAVVMEGQEPPPPKAKRTRWQPVVIQASAGVVSEDQMADGHGSQAMTPRSSVADGSTHGGMGKGADAVPIHEFHGAAVDHQAVPPPQNGVPRVHVPHVVIDSSAGRHAADVAGEAHESPEFMSRHITPGLHAMPSVHVMPHVVAIELREIPDEPQPGEPGYEPPVYPVRL